jgi:hypothetical protein
MLGRVFVCVLRGGKQCGDEWGYIYWTVDFGMNLLMALSRQIMVTSTGGFFRAFEWTGCSPTL